MLSPLRNRFGIPGVISVIALVFAMLGGAYAASNNSGGKATASAKGKPGPRGPRGKTGPAGPAGPTGPAGAQGAAGAAGKDGANGLDGEDGKAGKEGAKGKDGTNGTNGAPGPVGPEGEPWTAGGTLPKEETETGTWAFGALPHASCTSESECTATVETPQLGVPLSFSIPLAAELDEEHVHYINTAGKEGVFGEELEPVHCGSGIGPGVNAANPQADPGHLCVYAASATGFSSIGFFPFIINAGLAGGKGASVAGATLFFVFPQENGEGHGTWAVTAP